MREPADCGTVGCTIFSLIIFPIITWLIFPCAILGNTENYKKTPLHVAVTTGDPDMVALLLEFGADRNAPATFWNCCGCEKTPTQFVPMHTGEGRISVEQRLSIYELFHTRLELYDTGAAWHRLAVRK